MVDIEQIALKTYELNMQYIQTKHPTLYRDLLALDTAIQNNQFPQQYDLEYVEENFDIKEISTGKYIYNKKSKQISQSYTEHVTLKKSNGSIESFDIHDIDNIDSSYGFISRSREYIYPLMTYYINHSKDNTNMKEIMKFIFSGVGLGLHIEAIHNKIQAKKYLIIEDNIEIFKLSLFTAKYYEIAKHATIYFSVLEDIHTFAKTYNRFLKDGYIYNHLLKYTHLTSHSYIKLKHMIAINSAQIFVIFSYQLQLDRFVSPLKYLKKGCLFLDIYKDIDQTLLKNKPLLIIASGPSLGKNIQWLKNNYKKFVIIAVSSSLGYLYKNNITPDIVVSIDQQEHIKDFFSDYTDGDYLKNTLLLFSSATHENVIKTVRQDNLYITDASLQFKSQKPTFSFSCIGSFAYLYTLSLKTDNVYLLGLDLAVDQETGEDHISEHMSSATVDMDTKTAMPTNVSLTDTLIPIEGNFDKTVYTTPAFQDSISTINTYALNLKTKTHNIYNLNHGAKIAGAQAMRVADIDINSMPTIDKFELYTLLKKHLNQNASKELSKAEQERVFYNEIVLKKVKKLLMKYSKRKPSLNYATYLTELFKFSNDISQCESNRLMKLVTIYEAYFEYVLNIIYSFFNTQDLQDIQEHIVEFDKIIFDGLTKITKQFEESLN